jgi:hypothetical protein
MLLKDWLELIDYRITEGYDYQWQCFGGLAHGLTHWDDSEQDNPSFTIIFDRGDQTVYQMEAWDYRNNRVYRWTNPNYKAEFDDECRIKNVDNMAYDSVPFTDLEVEDDFFEKAQAIYDCEDYDNRVKVPVNFTDEELLTYMKLAHDRDITFNQLVEEALRAAMDEMDRDPEGFKQRAEGWKHEKGLL